MLPVRGCRLRQRADEMDGGAPVDGRSHQEVHQGRHACACDIRYRGHDRPDQWASVDGPFNLLVASNLSHLAPDMNLVPDAKIDDGFVHLGVGRGLTRTAMLGMLAFEVEHGRHVARDGLSLQACSEIELIPMRRSLCDIDGERYAFGSVRCLARPGAAQLILGHQAHKPL
ncbi:YegS/DAGK C-terminal domain-containing protein [Plasmodiophora brassicae]|uniref:YegS/DAGK C-terminal domain-containing protein n=1 Tax=Plasmodiophora brassicae TaxID=37360 RepID=A0A0G4J145_PLABS|nr:hypothetical protein PBRA_008348 [Plasmodiophora brassicae]SPQ98470.1 unnamed protein product [Plasmodiophora brassicae]